MRTLLELALPGIDPNDPRKLLLTLHTADQLLLLAPRAAPGGGGADGGAALGRGAARAALRSSADGGDGEALARLEAAEAQAAHAEGLACWLPEWGREVLRRLLEALETQERAPKGGGGWQAAYMLVPLTSEFGR